MTFTRRKFCTTCGAVAALSASDLLAEDPAARPLRVIAYNIYALKGWPYQRDLAKQAVAKGQMAERMAMELALHAPDIVTFSESPPEKQTQEIGRRLGMNHVRFPSGGNWPGTLLSRHKIVDSQNAPLDGPRPKDLFTRHWGRATIQLPSGQPLIVHSAHLYPGADPAKRLSEVRVMLRSMKADLTSGRSILLMGDLNHAPDTEEYRLWMNAGFVDTFTKVGNGAGATIKSDIPKWRIDYVMAAGPIAADIAESRPLFKGAFRLNIDDKNSFALSDHLPQLAVFHPTP